LEYIFEQTVLFFDNQNFVGVDWYLIKALWFDFIIWVFFVNHFYAFIDAWLLIARIYLTGEQVKIFIVKAC
jgi:hypothetical protein